jgi:hypothetical protein
LRLGFFAAQRPEEFRIGAHRLNGVDSDRDDGSLTEVCAAPLMPATPESLTDLKFGMVHCSSLLAKTVDSLPEILVIKSAHGFPAFPPVELFLPSPQLAFCALESLHRPFTRLCFQVVESRVVLKSRATHVLKCQQAAPGALRTGAYAPIGT